MRRQPGLPPRRGTILVYLSLLIFGLMGMAALAVDMGLLIVTQQQMQSAVNSAALEGLRWRDTYSDTERRQMASDQVTRVFDYRIRSDNDRAILSDYSYDIMQVGAGPVLLYSGGVTQMMALQQVQVPAQSDPSSQSYHVYKPSAYAQSSATFPHSTVTVHYQPLQLNDANNAQSGDLVAGTFGTNSSYSSSNLAIEDNQYNRGDFVPSASESTAGAAPSFLARMRRTNDFQGLDNVSGVSSLGPTLPFVFARGSLMTASPNANNYNPREHGLTVRATAIADAKPAKSVGPAFPSTLYTGFSGIQGLAPFALSVNAWNSLAQQAQPTVTVQNNGQLTLSNGTGQMIGITSLSSDASAGTTSVQVTSAAGFPTTASPFVPFLTRIDNEIVQVTAVSGTSTTQWTVVRAQDGTQAVAHTASSASVLLHQGTTIAQALAPLSISQLPTQSPDQGAPPGFCTFAPLYDDTSLLIVGFGPVTWSVSGSWGTAPQLNIAVRIPPSGASGTIAAQNASAAFTRPLPTGLTSSQLTAVMASNSSLTNPLQAPALVQYVKP